MIKTTVTLNIPGGLHLRPAEQLCGRAMHYRSDVELALRDGRYNAKSVLSVLGACVKRGDEIEFVCEGEDEEEALSCMVHLVDSGLGE